MGREQKALRRAAHKRNGWRGNGWRGNGWRSNGFTIVELMVVVSIVAVLAALALPNFRDTLEHYRLRRTAEDLRTTLYFARTEALRRGGNVVLARTSLVAGGCPAPGAAGDWGCGWSVLAMGNGESGKEPELLQRSPVPAGVRITQSRQQASLKVDRWGQFDGAGMVSFRFHSAAHPERPELSAALCIGAGGRLRTVRGADTCS
jgi:type IV fimbrial biogenesis protein FimT